MAVGMWVRRDALKHELSWWAVGPCLFFTLMFGPAGFGAYCVVRWARAGVTDWE